MLLLLVAADATVSHTCGGGIQAARGRAEALEGTLAECRGRVAGLGEGCGRCWEMLDEAQVRCMLRALPAQLCSDALHGGMGLRKPNTSNRSLPQDNTAIIQYSGIKMTSP